MSDGSLNQVRIDLLNRKTKKPIGSILLGLSFDEDVVIDLYNREVDIKTIEEEVKGVISEDTEEV